MTLAFDFDRAHSTEFGVGRDDAENKTFELIPIDGEVQRALQEMAQTTWNAMRSLDHDPPRYEPSEKHEGREYLSVPLEDDLAEPLRQIHESNNLPLNTAALSNPSGVFCYFARMIDRRQRRLTAIRRATQFKGVLKSRLIRLTTDALRIIEDTVFKLDTDFDLLIDKTNIQILRPSGFEFLGELKQAVLSAVPKNVKAIQGDLGFVDFDQVQDYASGHPRAARYLASIRSQSGTRNIDKRTLKLFCKNMGIDLVENGGKIVVPQDQVMAFLEVLDRRRYEVELIKGSSERFRAASRRKLGEVGRGQD